MIEYLERFCEETMRRKKLGLLIFEILKICMREHQLVLGWRMRSPTIFPHNNTITLKVSLKHIFFYLSFGCSYETYPSVSTRMYAFADIVLIEESREELNGRLETRRQALKVNNFIWNVISGKDVVVP